MLGSMQRGYCDEDLRVVMDAGKSSGGAGEERRGCVVVPANLIRMDWLPDVADCSCLGAAWTDFGSCCYLFIIIHLTASNGCRMIFSEHIQPNLGFSFTDHRLVRPPVEPNDQLTESFNTLMGMDFMMVVTMLCSTV